MQAGREIKFQVWDQDAKKMWSWEDIIEAESAMFITLLDILRHDQFIKRQFTGVHDDQDIGEELYDGDVVEVEYSDYLHTCKVIYEGCAPMFVADGLPDGFLWFTEVLEADSGYWWVRGTKKIGNIYENPELLEVGN